MQLTQLSIQGPGSQGLNSEISPFQQSIEFALKADNAVIDRVGRLAAREAFADHITSDNFLLNDDEAYDIVRMETVIYDEQPPQSPIPDDYPKYNISEFNTAEYGENGVNLEEPAPMDTDWLAGFYSEYDIAQYGQGDEYNGRPYTNSESSIIVGVAGIRKKNTYFGINYSRYIVFEVRNNSLSRLGNWEPKNGVTDCQLVPFMDSIYLFSKGEPPIVFNRGSSALLSSFPDYKPPRDGDRADGSEDGLNIIAPELDGDIACAAYGRLWVSGVNNNYDVIYYSDLLVPYQWYDGSIDSEEGLPEGEDPFNSGGIIDVREYWPTGNDKIQGIAAHNGFLIIFGNHSILIYSGAQGDPAGENGLKLEDAIRDVGLVNQDAMCNIGTDHLFVDSLGVRSLGRVVQEKSVPLAEPSLNVATVIREQIAENRDTVRLHHLISKNIAVCLFPFDREAYAFQLGQPSATGGLRTTFWTGCDWYDGCTVRNDYKTRELLGGMDSRGVTIYDGYTQPTEYTLSYESTVLLSGNDLMQTLVPKSVLYSFHHHHDEQDHAEIKLFSRWGFGTEEMPYMSKCNMSQNYRQTNVNTCKVNMAGSGEMLRIGFDCPIHNHPFSMQQISINTLAGRKLV
jgi:hypothetical protein